MNGQTKWIWINELDEPDNYGDFVCDFELGETGGVTLNIAADTEFVAYINGELAAFGQYADYPQKRIFDTVDISEFCVKGKNRIAVQVFYSGNGECFTSYPKFAGVIFDISQSGKLIAASNEKTLCRQSVDYISGNGVKITPQIGYGYSCNLHKRDEWMKTTDKIPAFHNAVVKNIKTDFAERPIKKLVLKEPIKSKLTDYGSFKLTEGSTPAEKMMKAVRTRNATAVEKNGKTYFRSPDKGIFFIVDLGAEQAGYLDFIIETKEKTIAWFAYGEHLNDGFVRGAIWQREFCFPFTLKKGRQDFTGLFRRLGARYIEVFAFTNEITVERVTVRPAVYPIEKKSFTAPNEFMQRLYDVSVHTLECCMHEHYEDCPWREQSFYALDSRLQMLAGYYALKNYSFARAGLELISRDPRSDGQLSICFPSANDLTIPSFTLHYIMQVSEYYRYTGDTSLVLAVRAKIDEIIKFFRSQKEGRLLKAMEGARVWNFYEWTDGMSGNRENRDYELVLNELYICALDACTEMQGVLGKEYDFTAEIEEIKVAVREKFYDSERGLYKSFASVDDHFSELGNALAILSGVVTGKEAIGLINKTLADENIVRSSLSMKSFTYFAMLKADEKLFAKAVIKDICAVYGRMLDQGATSFWETEKGEADFGDAGSLCHGWSTAPALFFPMLKAELNGYSEEIINELKR